jgi:menaquinone-dependent protoporphyrinogen oxidase
MTNILVIFGTTDGHTRKVAQFLAASLRAADALIECDVIRAGHIDVSPQQYDAVIVCASVQGGKYQKPVANWVRRHAAALNQKPTAFVSVCLGVLQKDPAVDRQLEAIVERFFARAGWHANRVKQIAGALVYTKYGWLKRWIMKRIVAKAGGDIDTTRDYEYTDWPDLQAFAAEFHRLVVPQRPSATAGP